jgi:ubiquinone/menaquinone biosynthesis C-methylase UbiE
MTALREEIQAGYVLGEGERERRRLLLQASILNPLTERFLRDAGITRGMRVLDLGCGAGDVSMIAAKLTGPSAEVVGIDVSEPALALARQRAQEAGLQNLRFEHANFLEYRPESRYDAAVGRHILLHLPDPAKALDQIASFLTPSGLAAFQEYDFSNWRVAWPGTPLAGQIGGSMVELFRRTTPYPDVGSRIYHLMLQAGFGDVRSSGECVIDGGSRSPAYEWLAETAISVSPIMQALGIAMALGEEDTLAVRLKEEFTSARACICSPLIVSTAGHWRQ